MRRLIFLLLVLILAAGCIPESDKKVVNMEKGNILMIVAQEGFQPIEFSRTKAELENAGYGINPASIEKGTAKASDGSFVNVISLKEINLDDYKAVVVIGGAGALSLGENIDFINLIKEADAKEMIIGAICISPLNIAKAGILKGKKSTVWYDSEKSPATEIEKYGALFVDKPVVADGRIITANGPSAAEEFGKKIIEAIENAWFWRNKN